MSDKDAKSKFNTVRYRPVRVGETITDAGGLDSTLDPDNPRGSVADEVFINSATDNLANSAEAVISFQHVPSGKDVYFKAFITTFSDSLSPSYSEETVFGRTDPIYTFKNTTRNISLNWKVPAETISEAYENLVRAQKLAQFVYPNYDDINNALTLTQTPLVRLKVMNLLAKTAPQSARINPAEANSRSDKLREYRSTSKSSQGALGVIKSITILHNLENFDAGVIFLRTNTVLPKLIEINISFDVIHEDTLGWSGHNFKSKGFPYNVKEQEPITDQDLSELTTFDERLEERRAASEQREMASQDRANAEARYAGMGGNARFKQDQKRIQKLKDKDRPLNDRQQANFDYLNSTVRGQQQIKLENEIAQAEIKDAIDPGMI